MKKSTIPAVQHQSAALWNRLPKDHETSTTVADGHWMTQAQADTLNLHVYLQKTTKVIAEVESALFHNGKHGSNSAQLQALSWSRVRDATYKMFQATQGHNLQQVSEIRKSSVYPLLLVSNNRSVAYTVLRMWYVHHFLFRKISSNARERPGKKLGQFTSKSFTRGEATAISTA